MKPYTVAIDIDLPRSRVIELFDSEDNLYKWQTGLQSVEHLSGDIGQIGSQTKLVYLSGKNRIELTETITHRNLPDEFHGTYEWLGGANTLENRFLELGPNRTRWESTCSYQFHTLFMKLMGLFAPGMFRKQNMGFLENFRAFAEDGVDVRDSKK